MNTLFKIIVYFALLAASLRADETENLKSIIKASNKSFAEFVEQILKAPPQRLRCRETENTESAKKWDIIAEIMVEKLLAIGGERFVMDKNFGISELKKLSDLRGWLLRAPPAYFNIAYATIAEATIARSSMALLVENKSAEKELKTILEFTANASINIQFLLDLIEKSKPDSGEIKQLIKSYKTEKNFPLLGIADQLSVELKESIPVRPEELLNSTKLAGLLFLIGSAKIWNDLAILTCTYIEDGGAMPLDLMELKNDLQKHLPDAFNKPIVMAGVKLTSDDLADAILSAFKKRKK